MPETKPAFLDHTSIRRFQIMIFLNSYFFTQNLQVACSSRAAMFQLGKPHPYTQHSQQPWRYTEDLQGGQFKPALFSSNSRKGTKDICI